MSIVRSRLDNDLYQFTMSQCITQHFPGRHVRYELIQRSANRRSLEAYIDPADVETEIDHVLKLRLSSDELQELHSSGLFDEVYLEKLSRARLPRPVVSTEGGFAIHVEGPWEWAVFWETHLLSIVSELYGRTQVKDDSAQWLYNVTDKLQVYEKELSLPFMEFGTRRRHSFKVQDEVIRQAKGLDCFTGTSNVHLAVKHGVSARGTMAHQLFMVVAADAQDRYTFECATRDVLEAWEATYDHIPRMLTALTDTFTTKFFLDIVPTRTLKRWRGFRQDSGDPELWYDTLLQHDPNLTRKNLVYSDALNINRIRDINFKIGTSSAVYGWGTDLTCAAGYRPLNIVMKPVLVDGALPVVKLSDEPGKSTGDLKRIRQVQEWIADE